MYRETRRYCKDCGRETVHWRPWTDWRDRERPEGWLVPVVAFVRAVRRLRAQPWRCLECDHPWNTSLLREQVPPKTS